ncbi:metallophosphoesterase [Paracoccus aerodenitrificans]|uniref:metallophosphoesterase n=1 Tax=Paracoccus aerodenitrificans TaxID=3017781 RepID=UPI0022EFF3F8|nr:metallophosphoesterase [Paracoccus aerodenitrificans]WBU64237.1 metallophosphoesterase [Paracoccus aerodenitrificans]
MSGTDADPVYVLGDVHGQLELLKHAHGLAHRDGGENARIVHLGDLIDRGPDSRGVIDYLMEGQARGHDWPVVRGNHDHKLPRFLEDPGWIDPGPSKPAYWTEDQKNGADATFASYGIPDAYELPLAELHERALRAIPPEHGAWVDAMPLYLRDPRGYFFVHAGVKPGVPLEDQSQTDLMWIRRPFHDSRLDHGAMVVHGHTPVKHVTNYGNRLNMDTGAAYGGPVSIARLEAKGVIWLLTESGPQPVAPEPDAVEILWL